MNAVGLLISFAVLLQTLEMFFIRNVLGEFDPWGVHRAGQADRGYLLVLLLRLAAALLAFVWPSSLVFVVMLLTTWAIAIRFRGTFNGGSDAMTFHVLGAAVVYRIWPQVEVWSLAYVAVHACLSYFVAGISKAREWDWWNGEALTVFIGSSNAASSSAHALSGAFAARPVIVRSLSAAVIIFDLLFPLTLIFPNALFFFLPLGALFHLGNFFLFGLNRFVFAWLATYPAIYFFSHYLHS